jgi:hypothetical protein
VVGFIALMGNEIEVFAANSLGQKFYNSYGF